MMSNHAASVATLARVPSEAPSAGVRDKIKTLDEIAAIVRRLQVEGRSVTLAHGTFDLLHMGHVRHLEQARREGDYLVCTVTGDAFVNKGPGRPVFTSALRAEMLAALQYVDWVGVNEGPTAEPVIRKIRPDVYAKGSDYADAAQDITGNITEERRAVEACGGRIAFTTDITFSSSSLLNSHFDIYHPVLREYLDAARRRNLLPQLLKLIDSVADFKILVVGDIIIDEYQYVAPMGKTPKENIIATLFKERELFSGGVVAAANHAASFCRQVDVLTCIGEHDSHEQLVRESLKPNVNLTAMMRCGFPTTRKCRFIDRDYMRKLFEVYVMDDTALGGALEAQFAQNIRDRAADYDAVIVTDFGHGLITRNVIDALTVTAPFLAVNAQSNSANQGFNLITKYDKADYLCIDAPEARLAVSDKFSELGVIASELLPARIDCDRLVLTHGRYGCMAYDKAAGVKHIPAFTRTVVDTVGAGDAFLAVTSPLVATGADMELIAFIGNAVGAMKVGIVGHRNSVEKVPLVKYLQALLK
jgi:rfaE bifunctional protein nucleotidyltransferase chain/domain